MSERVYLAADLDRKLAYGLGARRGEVMLILGGVSEGTSAWARFLAAQALMIGDERVLLASPQHSDGDPARVARLAARLQEGSLPRPAGDDVVRFQQRSEFWPAPGASAHSVYDLREHIDGLDQPPTVLIVDDLGGVLDNDRGFADRKGTALYVLTQLASERQMLVIVTAKIRRSTQPGELPSWADIGMEDLQPGLDHVQYLAAAVRPDRYAGLSEDERRQQFGRCDLHVLRADHGYGGQITRWLNTADGEIGCTGPPDRLYGDIARQRLREFAGLQSDESDNESGSSSERPHWRLPPTSNRRMRLQQDQPRANFITPPGFTFSYSDDDFAVRPPQATDDSPGQRPPFAAPQTERLF